MSLGGVGVISVLSNILPEYTHNIVYEYLKGNVEKARELQLKVMPLIKVLFSEVNPIPIKEALNIMGFEFGKPRLPLIKLSENNRKILKQEIERIKE